jgi:hypothetical protein
MAGLGGLSPVSLGEVRQCTFKPMGCGVRQLHPDCFSGGDVQGTLPGFGGTIYITSLVAKS